SWRDLRSLNLGLTSPTAASTHAARQPDPKPAPPQNQRGPEPTSRRDTSRASPAIRQPLPPPPAAYFRAESPKAAFPAAPESTYGAPLDAHPQPAESNCCSPRVQSRSTCSPSTDRPPCRPSETTHSPAAQTDPRNDDTAGALPHPQ